MNNIQNPQNPIMQLATIGIQDVFTPESDIFYTVHWDQTYTCR